MKQIQPIMLCLAVLVIFSFLLSGVAIGYRNYLLACLFALAGFGVMGVGLARKRKLRKEA